MPLSASYAITCVFCADAPVAQRLRETFRIRQRMPAGRRRDRTRQVAIQMRVNGAWNVPGAICRLARRRLRQIEATVDDQPVWIGQVLRQSADADECGVVHVGSLLASEAGFVTIRLLVLRGTTHGTGTVVG